ncbi:MAG: HDIG domain-containing protein [Nitrospiraceae bacterium]|nr:HDIG domain-containing protein [Nitrospiraceae bacterium]
MTERIDPMTIIAKYYQPASLAYEILVEHSKLVARKSLEIAEIVAGLSPDREFIGEAAMLHDIGIFMTDAPGIGCFGDEEYICHGYLGRELLEREGLPRHGLVCERHIGVGVTAEDIEKHDLPLPGRDMMPVSIEEKIICYADKFFSKKIESLGVEKTLEKIRAEVGGYGPQNLRRFEELHALFSR